MGARDYRFAAAALAILSGDTKLKTYLASLSNCNVEAVFNAWARFPAWLKWL